MPPWSTHFNDRYAGLNTVVTGGAGFIGSHLSDALLSLGANVTIIDDLSGGLQANVDYLTGKNGTGRLKIVTGSILDQVALNEALSNAQYVFHQAALGSVPRSLNEPDIYMQVNIVGTLNLLKTCASLGVKRVVFASSSSVYGDSPTLPKHEQMPHLPKSPYAVSKAAGEGLMRTYAENFGVDTVSLRYFNIFGPRQNANSAYAAVIAAFAKALLQNQPASIYGDGTQSRDFTYVDNAVYANLLAALSPEPLRGVAMNVATGRQTNLNELYAKVSAEFPNNPAPRYLASRKGDVLHSLADISLAKEKIGYTPLVAVDEGLSRTMQWYKSQKVK